MLLLRYHILLTKIFRSIINNAYCLPILLAIVFLDTHAQTTTQPQTQTISGRVIEAYSGSPLPFARIYLNNNSKAILADANGFFSINTSQKPIQICAKAVLHRSVCVLSDTADQSQNPYFVFELKENSVFYVDKNTPKRTADLIKKVIANKPINIYNYSYKAYNKIIVRTDSLDTFKKQAKKWVKGLDLSGQAANTDHHLFLIESYSEMAQRYHYQKSQIVRAARISGIRPERALGFAASWQISGLYDEQIVLGQTKYMGILAKKPLKQYNFQIYDTCLTTANDTIFIIKLHSKTRLAARGLKGFLYISSRNYSAIAAELEPALQTDHTLSLSIQNQWTNNKLMPAQWRAAYQLPNLPIAPSKVPIMASNSVYSYDYKFDQSLKKADFGHIGLDAQKTKEQNDAFWQAVRACQYVPADSQTFAFYQKQKNLKHLDRLIGLGNELYEKRLPLGKIDLLLDRLIRINQFEGLRPGLGLATNQKFDPNWQLSGYIARGLADKQTKFGLEINKKIGLDAMLGIGYSDDLRESGGTQLAYQTNQFESERLRLLRANRFDRLRRLQIPYQIRLFEYLQTQTTAFYENITPLYSYQFADNQRPDFEYLGLQASVRLAWAEQYSSFGGRKKLISASPFPSLLIGITQGWGVVKGSNNYFKTEARLDYGRYILGFGKSAGRLEAGWLSGQLPYSLLFVGKGSWRPGSVITHNSFETMRYNEFVFNQYLVFYYTHNFGYIHFEGLPFYPSIEISHNMGIGRMGSDQDKSLHSELDFQTMEKGYLESGIFVNDLFVFRISSLRLGIGAGGFRRYGPYSLKEKNNNTVLKFALKISG